MKISRVLTGVLTAMVLSGGAAPTFAQAPAPFLYNYAGVPTGGTACSTDIPSFKGAFDDGDSCLPSQATFSAPSSTAVDAYGNVYISDNTHRQLRVIYEGGPVLEAMLKAASPAITGAGGTNNWNPGGTASANPIPGHIYTLAGGPTATLVKSGTPSGMYCNQAGSGTPYVTSNGDGCPATEAFIAPRGIEIDSYGNVYITSTSGGDGLRIIYAGGTATTNPVAYNLINLENYSTSITPVTPQAGYIYSITGSTTSGFLGDGSNARNAEFSNARDVVVDSNGNLFISDGNSSTSGNKTNSDIRVVYAGGTVVANLITAYAPSVTTPTVGDIYSIISGPLNSAGSVVAPFQACPIPGTVYSGVPPETAGSIYGGDGGPAAKAVTNSIYSMFEDPAGNLYFADSCNGRLRVIYMTAGSTIPNVNSPVVGDVYTVAGGGTTYGPQTGVAATSLAISLLQAAGIDAAGNLYVADNANHLAWQINPKTGIAILFSGLGAPSGDYPVNPTTSPSVLKEAPASGSFCSTTVSSGPKSTDGVGDGCPALQAAVSPSLRFAGDNLGNIYSVDNATAASGATTGEGVIFNANLRQYSYNNVFSSAGPPVGPTSTSIVATAVGSSTTQPLAFTVPALETDNFELQGTSTTEFRDAGGTTCSNVASVPSSLLCVYNNIGFYPAQAGTRDGAMQLLSSGSTILTTEMLTGSGTAAQLSIDPSVTTPGSLGSGLIPQGVAADLSGNLYVADASANQVDKIVISSNTSSPLITGLSNPNQVAIDGAGNLYVADTGNNRIVELPAGGATVNLGTGLVAPQGVAVDSVGNLYIADTGNSRIVEIIANGGPQVVFPVNGLLHPTHIAFDTANDLFIADTGNNRVVEFSSSLGQTVVSFGSSVTSLTPVGLGLDAAGDLYVADSAGLQVLELLAGTAQTNIVLSNLLAPADVTVGSSASVYVADTQTPSVIYLNRSIGTINLGITNIGETSTETFSLSNTGNAALSFSSPLSSPVGPAGSFSVVADATNGCAIGTPVLSGGSCLMDASYSPTSPGTPSQNYTFTSNAANNAAVQAALSGIGAHLTSTSMMIAISPSTPTIGFGAPVMITATVTPSSNVGTATGTISLFVDGKQQGQPKPFGTGTVTLTLNSPAQGTHTVTAKFSGDILYSSSSSTTTFDVVKASTVTTLGIVTSAPSGTPTVTFTAMVSSPTATGETGTVTFYSGSTPLSSAIPLSNTTATFATTSIVFPSNSFTAVYSGDGNFSTSTSAIVSPAADFTMAPTSSSLGTQQGGVASGLVTLTPVFGFAGTITPSCSNLPVNTVCRFNPASVTFSGNTPASIAIQIFTGVDPSVASVQRHDSNLLTLAMLSPLGIGALALFGFRRGKGTRLAQLLLVAIVALCAAGGISGCASSGNVLVVAPLGTTNITVTFTSSGSGTPQTHSIVFSFSVVP